MTKIYIFYLSFVLAIFISTITIGQVVVFEDKFDNYTVGQQLACQNPTIWKTWTNNPCSTTEDPLISDLYSFSGVNSTVIKQNNDIVREIGTPINSGTAEINFQVFIPAGKAGYFNTLASFAPPNYAWAMQVFLNSTGVGTVDAGATNAASFSFPQNQWFPVKIEADLTADSGRFWINGSLIHKWKWSTGTFGSSNDKRLDGTDFFGYTANDEMYIDDYNIVHTPYTSKVSSTTIGGQWNLASTWLNGNVPVENQTVEIVAGATVTLDGHITDRNSNTIVNGTLNCNSYNISGSGNFVLSAYATLLIGSENGISLTSATGNIQVTGIRAFNQFANYIYSGSTTQNTGNGLPASVKNLTINNFASVTLSANTSVSGALNLINGNLLTSTNTLSLGTSITNLGTLTNSAGKILGNFNRWISNSSNILFPVGTSATKYTPVELSNVVGSGTFTVNAIPGMHPNAPGSNLLQMYWKLTNGGLTSADLTFHYLDADVVGDENQYELGRYNGISWDILSPISLNTTSNTASIAGINSFSDWTLGEDGALPVELKSFTATTIGSKVRLNWNTATEINNYGFEIERCAPSAEHQAWEKIGFVNGSGNSNSPKSYTFIDDNVSSEKYSYRLKQIDNDGQFEYSSPVQIDLASLSTFSLHQNYPNPFNPSTTIQFSLPAALNVKIIIFNLLGQEIQTLVNETKEAGIHEIIFDAQNLNSGVYLYKIEAGSYIQTRKMTLIK